MGVHVLHLKLRPTALARRYNPGHYLTIGTNNAQRDNYASLLALPGVQGVQFRYQWKVLEPSQDVYNVQPILDDLAICEAAGKQLIAMVEDKSFDGTKPGAAYLDAYQSPNSGGGYSIHRWDAFPLARIKKLVTQLAAVVDGEAYFQGVAFQETALGLTGTVLTNNGYTDLAYRDALIDQLLQADADLPHCRVFWYQNFFPTAGTDFRLDEVADAVKGRGVILGGPDILPDSTTIESRCYPRYRNMFGQIKLFCSNQNDSYRHPHSTSSPPDTKVPGETWANGDYWTMLQLHKWGRDNLKLNYMMWENVITAQPADSNNVADAKVVIAANPTFNTGF